MVGSQSMRGEELGVPEQAGQYAEGEVGAVPYFSPGHWMKLSWHCILVTGFGYTL